jgi:hypothetical protein
MVRLYTMKGANRCVRRERSLTRQFIFDLATGATTRALQVDDDATC